MKHARMNAVRKEAAPQGDPPQLRSDSKPYWDRAAVRQFLRAPLQQLHDSPWADWLRQRGGITGVQAYLRTIPLSQDERLLLDLLIDRPREVAKTYADALQISCPTYFYRLHHLLDLLANYLNMWEIAPQHADQEHVSQQTGAHSAPPNETHLPKPQQQERRPAAHVLPIRSADLPLVEREIALQAVQQFLDRCVTRPRTVLRIEGVPGSGRSRFLLEAGQRAQQRGALVMHLADDSRQVEVLTTLVQQHQPAPVDAAQTDQNGALPCQLPIQAGQLLVLCIDNLPTLPPEIIGLVRQVLQPGQWGPVALLYTADSDDLDVLAATGQEYVTLQPLSLQGVAQWLAVQLGWYPEPGVLSWLHQQTSGRPACIDQGLAHLVTCGDLQHAAHGWWCNPELTSQSLAPYLPQHHSLPSHNLPRFTTSFVGRIQEANLLAELVQSNRLVTLVGLGGIGKTRLATYVAALLRRRFVDGVAMVTLSTITDPQHVLPLIAHALGIKDEGHGLLLDWIAGVLAQKHILLILDDAEHVPGCGGPITSLLERTRYLTVLVASRERLWVHGETAMVLDGLSHVSGVDATLAPSDAVQLFLQRTEDIDRSLAMTAAAVPEIVRICELVQGMPLAIELAAAWVQLLPCQEIATKIIENLDFLVTRLRNVPERHRSLRAVFDYSWASLSPQQQAGFQQLAVFRGGFCHIAAETIAGVTLPLLNDLLAMLLVRRTHSDRYEVHALLCQYAADHLAALPELQEQTYARHAAYYLSLAEHAGAEEYVDRKVWLEQLETEQGNFRVALQWSCTTQRTQLAQRLCLALWPFWETQGYLSEGSSWLSAALACGEQPPATTEDALLVGRCQHALAALSILQTQYDAAWQLLGSAYATFVALGDRQRLSEICGLMGDVRRFQGDYIHATNWYQQQYDYAGDKAQREQRARALIGLGSIAFEQGSQGEARDIWRQAVSILPAKADRLAGAALSGIGIASCSLGEYEQAFDPLCQAIQKATRHGVQVELARAIGNLGTLYTAYGQLDAAQICFQRSLGLSVEMRHLLFVGCHLAWLGRVLGYRAEIVDATTCMARSIALLRAHALPYYLWTALNHQADIYQQQGHWEEAMTALREALALSHANGFSRTSRSRLMVLQLLQLEVILGQRTLDEAIQEIGKLSQEWISQDLQAALCYTLWRLTPDHEAERQKAADYYAALHTTTPYILYRQRYYELTGQPLLAPPPLPAPPPIVVQRNTSLAAILDAANRLIGPDV